MVRGLDGCLDFLTPYLACAVFKLHRASRKIPVAHSERETPLPIPNRAVKPFSADGTWGATPWESRSPPVLSYCGPRLKLARAAADEARRIPPSSASLRSAATRRCPPRTACLPLGRLAAATV